MYNLFTVPSNGEECCIRELCRGFEIDMYESKVLTLQMVDVVVQLEA